MKDPIERQDAIERITNQYMNTTGGLDRYAVGINVGLTKSMNTLKDMPSVEAIPVSWIEERIENAINAKQTLIAQMWQELIDGYTIEKYDHKE